MSASPESTSTGVLVFDHFPNHVAGLWEDIGSTVSVILPDWIVGPRSRGGHPEEKE